MGVEAKGIRNIGYTEKDARNVLNKVSAHHYQTTIFGGALLYNECMECFEWVIGAWMRAMNGFWDDFVKCLYGYETVETFELSWNGMIGRRDAENDEDYESNYTNRALKFSMVIEKEVTEVYTKEIFARHIMKIFVVVDVLNPPEKYVLKRWTKDAKSGSVTTKYGEEMLDDYHVSVTVRFSQLCRKAVHIATKGASSLKAFKVAMKGFYNLLKEVEATLKNVEISLMKQIGSAPSEKLSQTKSGICMRKVKPLKDPPIVKHKGRLGRQKSWTDNNGKKQTRTNPGQAKDVKKLARFEL
ncbi:hypothetical protein IFM89_024836 [Coptis chinensis]|uniref:Protein FAR1-RELATED SEQUENCE n=1 Tax=Coptis chinensis TaxID=261450 RepID=A0A835HMA1_9MAGN|nr:hypothetical protein IFM89_024836 [Coptis chinensis]